MSDELAALRREHRELTNRFARMHVSDPEFARLDAAIPRIERQLAARQPDIIEAPKRQADADLAQRLAQLERRVAQLETRQLKYVGVWQSGTIYEPGSFATHAGSTWHANWRTDHKPGMSDAWSLAVKQGKPGRAGKDLR